MIEPDLTLFAQSLQSLWAVDVLVLLQRERERLWHIDGITRELRSNPSLIREIVARLERLRLLSRQADGSVRYAPADDVLDGLVERLVKLRRERPLALVREIYGAPNEKLQSFSNAFKLKKD